MPYSNKYTKSILVILLALLSTMASALTCDIIVHYTDVEPPDVPEPYMLEADPVGVPPYIYVWQLDGDNDGITEEDIVAGTDKDVGYRKELYLDTLPLGEYTIFLKVSDAKTDTQILRYTLIEDEITSIQSELETDCSGIYPKEGTYDYNDYSISGSSKLGSHRLFERNSVWVKVLGVTPSIKDTKTGNDWTRSSPPDDEKLTVYVIAGCKRKSAGGADEYIEPINDNVTIVLSDGVNPPQSEEVRSVFASNDDAFLRSLLPFPPADSVGDDFMPAPDYLLHHHPYEGVRYSFFVHNFTIEDTAKAIDITAIYNCETTIQRSSGCSIKDKSSVFGKYYIKTGHISKSDMSHVNISLDGYYDLGKDPLTGKDVVVGGYIKLNMSPDILAGVMLSVDDNNDLLPSSVYRQRRYPARHSLLLKEKPYNPASGQPETREFYADDDYGYYSTEFGYDVRCALPRCEDTCECEADDPFNPVCWDMSNPSAPRKYEPNSDDALTSNDCRCYPEDDCSDDPCTDHNILYRDYHEFEEEYFDFVDFYTKDLTPPELYITTHPDTDKKKKIEIDDVNAFVSAKQIKPEDAWFCWCCSEGEICDSFDPKEYVINYVPYKIYVKGCPPFPVDNCDCYLAHVPGSDPIEWGLVVDGYAHISFNDFPGCTVYIDYKEDYPGASGIIPLDNCGMVGLNTITIGGGHDSDGSQDFGVSGCVHITYEETTTHSLLEDLHFTTYNIGESEFLNNGKITIYTHFRNKTFLLKDNLTKREATRIKWEATAPGYSLKGESGQDAVESGNLHVGDTVTVKAWLLSPSGPVAGEDIRVSVTNYENMLSGVWWDDGQAFATTDSSGKIEFEFRLGYDPTQISLEFDGSFTPKTETEPAKGYLPSKASFFLGVTEIMTPIGSPDFLLLILILFLFLLFWRWFRGGRLDFYSMWQELRGEPAE